MSGRIQVNYSDVSGETAILRSQISAELANMEDAYSNIQSMLNEVDSAANATLKEAMEVNRRKTLIAAMILDKLLSFMSNSSKQVETTEEELESFLASAAATFEGGTR